MMLRNILTTGLTVALLSACSAEQDGKDVVTGADAQEISVSDAELAGNPFREEWDTPYGIQPFDAIQDEHFMPAFKKGFLARRADIEAIVPAIEEAYKNSCPIALLIGRPPIPPGEIGSIDNDTFSPARGRTGSI